MDVLIRTAKETDYLLLPDVEVDAAQAFRDFGLDEPADYEPASATSYLNLPKNSAVFVADHQDRMVIGFVTLMPVDGQAYLKEVSVRRAFAGQGVGRQLIASAISWARQNLYQQMTLTTFADLPFNAPFYRKIGFSTFDPDQNWPELRAIRDHERKGGLELRPRVAMIKSLQRQAPLISAS